MSEPKTMGSMILRWTLEGGGSGGESITDAQIEALLEHATEDGCREDQLICLAALGGKCERLGLSIADFPGWIEWTLTVTAYTSGNAAGAIRMTVEDARAACAMALKEQA